MVWGSYVYKVGTAGADIGAEDVRTVALIMRAACHFAVRISDGTWVAEQVQCRASDRWKENLVVCVEDSVVLRPLRQPLAKQILAHTNDLS